jgi:general secretion pathway protein I
MPPARIHQAGFTLIEVLVALAIVAVTLGAGFQAAGALVNNAERFAEVSEAQWCAENALNGLRLARQYPGIGETAFSCEQLGRSYRGQMLVRATALTDFRNVEARVSDDQARPLLSLSTVIGRY